VRCPSWKWLWTVDRRVALSVFIGTVSVGVVVRCGGLMLRRVRHGRGGDAL
jgi:hypothetical protein